MLSSYNRARLLLMASAIVCFCVFWWMGRLARIPLNPGYEDSLLQQPSPLTALLFVAVAMIGCTALGTAVAGMIRFNAGLMVACLGLSALSIRSGPTRYTIWWGMSHGSDPAQVYSRLLFESVLLTVLIAVCWWALRVLYAMGVIRDRESRRSEPQPQAPQTPRLKFGREDAPPAPRSDLSAALMETGALAGQLLFTLLLIMFIGTSQAKLQVLAAVFLGSFLGPVLRGFISHTGGEGLRWLAGEENDAKGWYWLPPLLAGMIGYAIAANHPAGADVGHLTGTFAALARPLPLDYASLGTAGAILGHWTSRRWARQRQQEQAAGS